MPDIRVLIVDDHAILRDGLRSLLDRQQGITVVGEAGNPESQLRELLDLLGHDLPQRAGADDDDRLEVVPLAMAGPEGENDDGTGGAWGRLARLMMQIRAVWPHCPRQ